MFEELFDVAKNELAGIDETVVGLPEPQVTVLFTHNKNFYVAVNGAKIRCFSPFQQYLGSCGGVTPGIFGFMVLFTRVSHFLREILRDTGCKITTNHEMPGTERQKMKDTGKLPP